MRSSFASLLGGGIAAAAIVACGSNGTGDGRPANFQPDTDPNAELSPGSVVIGKPATDDADVRDGELRFPALHCDRLAKLQPGQIIIGDRGADGGANPDGFLRKVTKVTCTTGGVVVETQPATLQETFNQLKLDVGFNLPGCKDLKTPNMGVEYGGQVLQYNDVVKTADGRSVPFVATLGVDATLCFAPKLTYKADVQFPKLRSLELSATGILESKVLMKAAVKLDPAVDAKTREELAGKPFSKTISTILVDRNLQLGSATTSGIPLPASARFITTLSCDLAFTVPVDVEVGATATGTLTAGLTYADGHVAPKSVDTSFTYGTIPPTFKQSGMIRASCTMIPTLQLKILGAATGEIGAKVLGGMGASQTCGGKDAQNVTQRLTHGDVEAGLVSTVVAKLDLFGMTKWKKECTLFSEDIMLPYDHAYPTPGGTTAATCSVAGPYPLPPKPRANPAACFADDEAATDAGASIIAGTCAHDVCVAGEKLGQQCDACTMKVCAVDPYCCDTYWGLSCFDQVQKACGKKCP